MHKTSGTQIGRWFLLLVLMMSLWGCGQTKMMEAPPAPREYRKASVEGPEAQGTGGDEGALPATNDLERKIIYNVDMTLVVNDTSAALNEIEQIAGEMGGYVSSSNLWRDEGHQRARVTVRIPADDLGKAMERFRALAVEVQSESMDSQDVTEEYIDLAARLRNEERTEQELLELLKSRSETGDTADILEVHRELTQVRARIEQIKGRMKYLNNMSAMATVQIDLIPNALAQPISVGGWQPQGTARSSIRLLLRTWQILADIAIFSILYIVPVLLTLAVPALILFFIVRALWRRLRHKKQPAQG